MNYSSAYVVFLLRVSIQLSDWGFSAGCEDCIGSKVLEQCSSLSEWLKVGLGCRPHGPPEWISWVLRGWKGGCPASVSFMSGMKTIMKEYASAPPAGMAWEGLYLHDYTHSSHKQLLGSLCIWVLLFLLWHWGGYFMSLLEPWSFTSWVSDGCFLRGDRQAHYSPASPSHPSAWLHSCLSGSSCLCALLLLTDFPSPPNFISFCGWWLVMKSTCCSFLP